MTYAQLWSLGATGRRTRRPVLFAKASEAQVSEYRDLWHPCVLLIIALTAVPCFSQQQIKVEAGAHDRHNTIVTFPYAAKGSFNLIVAGDHRLPCTADGEQASFILDDLKANQSRSYKIEPAADAAPQVKITKNAGAYEFTKPDNKPILTYQSEKTPLPAGYDAWLQRGGYISPVFTPSGKILTDDYPPNHKHHHGIWSPWTKTEFEGRHPDFWNMQDKTGRVDPAGVIDSFTGSACAGLRAKHNFIDMTAKPEKVALHEQWDLTVYRAISNKNPLYIFDLLITQNVLDTPLKLPKYHYGGLGLRARREWNGPRDACLMLTSENKTRANGDETPARWVWVGGKAEGETLGIAILCAPTNFRAPQPIRLHPDMPYVSYTPSQLGDWEIDPGKPYIARYRFIAADGELNRQEMERLYTDYAEPPKVSVN